VNLRAARLHNHHPYHPRFRHRCHPVFLH
jgi:hypothetical protein